MLTVHGQQHSFSTNERMFLWKCQSFWDRKCLDLRKTRTPDLWIHAECSNHLSYQGQTFAVPYFFNTGSGGIDIFLSKVNICVTMNLWHKLRYFRSIPVQLCQIYLWLESWWMTYTILRHKYTSWCHHDNAHNSVPLPYLDEDNETTCHTWVCLK